MLSTIGRLVCSYLSHLVKGGGVLFLLRKYQVKRARSFNEEYKKQDIVFRETLQSV